MLVNPISFRLSICTFWRSIWTVYDIKNYKFLMFADLIFFEYFNWFCKKFFVNIIGNCIISHIRFYRTKKNFIINIFYYHSDFIKHGRVVRSLRTRERIKKIKKIKKEKRLNKKRKNKEEIKKKFLNNLYNNKIRLKKQFKKKKN